MRTRLLVASGLFLTVTGIALTSSSAYAYFWDRGRADVIGRGVSVAGIDIGGMRAADAQALLEARFGEYLRQPVRIVGEGHAFTLRPAGAGLRVDVAHMIEDAVAVTRRGGLAHRLTRDLRNVPLRREIPLRAALSRDHIATVVSRVARVIDRPAKNADVVPKPLATGLKLQPERIGIAVKQPLLEERLTNALLNPAGERTVAIPTRPLHPRWTRSNIGAKYKTFILVSRETYTLRLYKGLRLVKKYGIAVGQAGLETPAGLYEINDKQVNPYWHVPLSAWAGSLAGQVIPPGPSNPIKARWMGFFNGAGIHGTVEDWSIGTAASHGCIRMHIWDVEDLYERVPLHSPIYVG
jgi:lipoprotein-anchoring transpeptidase ErfK/SrfK